MVVAVDFSGLQAWADAAATILLIELIMLLVILLALVFVLALGARWLQMHVMPLLGQYAPRAQQAIQITTQGTDRVVQGVAKVYGLRRAVEAGLDVALHGRQGAKRGGLSPASQAAERALVDTSAAISGAPPSAAQRPAAATSRTPGQPPEEQRTSRRDPRGMTAHAG